MTLNYSLAKSPIQQINLNLNISPIDNSQLPHPTGRQKLQSFQQQLHSFSSEKYCLKSKKDKSQQRHFKIRNCKPNNKNSTMVGRSIQQIVTIPLKVRQRQTTIEKLQNAILKRASMEGTPENKNIPKNKQKHLFIPNCNNKQKLFDQLHSIQSTELSFTTCSMNILSPLAHKVEVTQNSFSHFSGQKQYQKKYRGGYRHHSARSSVDSHFSSETRNILKQLTASNQQKSFLNQCKLYFKVNSSLQSILLNDFLQQNSYFNYNGIINVQDKFVETYNLYSLKGIASQNDYVILLEDKHTLTHQFPLFIGQNYLIITPKSLEHNKIVQLINILRNISILTQLFASSTNRKNTLISSEDKENIDPNLSHFICQHTISTRKSTVESPLKKKKELIKLRVDQKLVRKQVTIDTSLLFSKVKCLTEGKTFKICRNSNSMKNISEKSVSETRMRDKSQGKRRRQSSFDSLRKVNLEGQFKDKMVTFIKILEVEKRQRPSTSASIPLLRDDNSDLVDELTSNLTSKLKNKTHYQMLGQMLRNNSHIAKQITKYQSQVAHLNTISEDCTSSLEQSKMSQNLLQQFLVVYEWPF